MLEVLGDRAGSGGRGGVEAVNEERDEQPGATRATWYTKSPKGPMAAELKVKSKRHGVKQKRT